MISLHEVVSTKRKDNVVLNLKVLRICEVLDTEESLNLGNTLLCKVNDLILLINDEVSGLFSLYTHDGIHLGKLFHILTASHLLSKDIACLIEFG